MITLTNGVTPDARSPTHVEYKGRKVVRHEILRDELARHFRFIYDKPLNFSIATTPDGMDAVLWAEVAETCRVASLRVGRYLTELGFNICIAVVHSNSRRQKSAFYGGLTGKSGVLVFDKIPFRIREQDLERDCEKTLARWGLFVDRYWERYRAIRDLQLTSNQYRSLLVECGRDDILSWSRMGKFDHERSDSETALNFLLRLSKHVGRQPPISHEPSRSQPWSLFCAYQRVNELRA